MHRLRPPSFEGLEKLLVLGESDVERHLSLGAAITAVRRAFAGAHNPRGQLPRGRMYLGATRLNVMGGTSSDPARMAVKAYSTNAENCVLLFDGDGTLLAAIAAKALSRLRTAAATAVATDALSRPGATSLALLGSGHQAEAQLDAVCEVRPVDVVRVWSPTATRRAAFAERMSARLGLDITASASVAEAVDGADIVVAATKAGEPFLEGAWLSSGTHVNLVGANHEARREAAPDVFSRSAAVVVDDLEQAHLESAELQAAVDGGALTWSDVVTLHDVLVGRSPGRSDDAGITIFKSLGVGLEDAAVASVVYDGVRSDGVPAATKDV